MAQHLDLEVHGLLASWAQWVRMDSTGLGYKSPMAALMRGQVSEKRKAHTAAYITDDEALKVEKLITKLCELKPLEGRILTLHYVDRMSASAIAKYYLTPLQYDKGSAKKVSAYTVRNYLAHAEGLVMGLMVRSDVL